MCLSGSSVYGERRAVHLEASRGGWHHHLASTATPWRQCAGAPVTPHCKGGWYGKPVYIDWIEAERSGKNNNNFVVFDWKRSNFSFFVHWRGLQFDCSCRRNPAVPQPSCHAQFLLIIRGYMDSPHPHPPTACMNLNLNPPPPPHPTLFCQPVDTHPDRSSFAVTCPPALHSKSCAQNDPHSARSIQANGICFITQTWQKFTYMHYFLSCVWGSYSGSTEGVPEIESSLLLVFTSVFQILPPHFTTPCKSVWVHQQKEKTSCTLLFTVFYFLYISCLQTFQLLPTR